MPKHRRPRADWSELRDIEPAKRNWMALVTIVILIGVLLVPALVLRFD